MSRFAPNPLWPAIGIVAAVAAPVSVTIAATYLTVDAAQKALFPAADSFVPVVLLLTDEQKRAALRGPGAQLAVRSLRSCRVGDGSLLLVRE